MMNGVYVDVEATDDSGKNHDSTSWKLQMNNDICCINF